MIIRIPATLTQDGKPGMIDLTVAGSASLQAVLDQVEARVPGATRKILDGQGRPHRYVNMYVNGDDVRFGSGLNTTVSENDEVLILPAISGG
jgi:molybdopterin synthase sulfur carrier subunit